MTDAPKISLNQQIEAVELAIRRQETLAAGGAVKGLRPRSVESYDIARLRAALVNLEWLARNHAEIREALAAHRQRQALRVTPEPA